VVEVLFASASIVGILSADAGANFGVVNGVKKLSGAVLGEALASAEFAVPVETLRASIDASRRRADTVADLLAPVVAICAEVGVAEAAAFRGVFEVGSPVLGQRADAWHADALAVLNAPGLTIWANLRLANTLAFLGVIDLIVGAGINW